MGNGHFSLQNSLINPAALLTRFIESFITLHLRNFSKVCNFVTFYPYNFIPQIPDKEKLGYGVYPVKMVVRGDHTLLGNISWQYCLLLPLSSVSASQMAVVPCQTEAVIFSIGKLRLERS